LKIQQYVLTHFSKNILEDGIKLEDGDEGLYGEHTALQIALALQYQAHSYSQSDSIARKGFQAEIKISWL
jgi:hypothetical protein